MKIKSLFVLAMVSLVLLSSCDEQKQFSKKITGDWWPVHAIGSIENDKYTASWDGDLDEHGSIEVSLVSRSNSTLVIKQKVYYTALRFEKDTRKRDAFRYLDIRSLANIVAGKSLKYQIEDSKIYFETTNENGTPTGQFDEGHPYSFKDSNTLKIGDVTYQAYKYYKETHPYNPVTEISDDSGLIPVMVYE